MNIWATRKARVRLAASAAVIALAGAGAVIGGAVPSLAGGSHQAPTPTIPHATATAVPSGVPTNVPPQATPPTWTIGVSDGQYGTVLVTSTGMALYRQSAPCTSCSAQYSPYVIPAGQALAKPPLLPGKLGTVTLPDGSRQVTYDGTPLFLYSGDHAHGEANGVGLYWMVAQPAS